MTRRRSFFLLASILALAGSIGATLFVGSRLCAPASRSIGLPPPGINAESVHISSESGSRLSAWFASPPDPLGAVVLLHCVRCNRLDMLPKAELLWQAGYAVLIPDLQAHGESPGEQITFGYLEARDARSAAAWLRSRLPNLPLAGLGTSLGGAALVLAAECLDLDAVVLESVYPTIVEAVSNRIAIRLGFLSKVLTPLLVAQLRPRLNISPTELRPIDRIGHLSCPVLILSGTLDRHTTKAETKRLFDAAPAPKQLWLVPGAAHQDLYRYSPETYSDKVLTFLHKYLHGRTSAYPR